jgi:hypothetical protein
MKEAVQRRRKRQGKGRGAGGEGALPSEDGGVLLDGRLAPPPLVILTINKGHLVNRRPARRSAAPALATVLDELGIIVSWIYLFLTFIVTVIKD